MRGDAFATPAATVARDSAGHVTVRATRITDAITIDGALGEGVYTRIQAIDGLTTDAHPSTFLKPRVPL